MGKRENHNITKLMDFMRKSWYDDVIWLRNATKINVWWIKNQLKDFNNELSLEKYYFYDGIKVDF